MEALPGLKAITASSKMKKKTKTPVERLEILTKQFPPDATLVGHLWYTAAPSLQGLWIKAISIFGLGIADFGLREGGAAEAAPIFLGILHRRVIGVICQIRWTEPDAVFVSKPHHGKTR